MFNDYGFFELPKKRPSSITDLSYDAQRKFSSISTQVKSKFDINESSCGSTFQ